MKKISLLIGIVVLISSCAKQHTCPTYLNKDIKVGKYEARSV